MHQSLTKSLLDIRLQMAQELRLTKIAPATLQFLYHYYRYYAHMWNRGSFRMLIHILDLEIFRYIALNFSICFINNFNFLYALENNFNFRINWSKLNYSKAHWPWDGMYMGAHPRRPTVLKNHNPPRLTGCNFVQHKRDHLVICDVKPSYLHIGQR